MPWRYVLSIGVFSFFTLFNVGISTSEIHKYEENNATLIAPERGFYKYFRLNKYGFQEYIDLANNRDFTWVRESGFSLISARVSLERYRYSDIPDAFLAQIQGGLDAVRAGGIKVILRFNYNNGNERGADTSLPWMLPIFHKASVS